jgi:sugar-specific transcriptional regulator TrmB
VISNGDEFEEEDFDEESLLKNLQRLGFTINDSRIYITLLKIGLNSPAKIAEKSQVDRARVYDSLKRLVKRKIVEEEPVNRAPRYRALPPIVVFEMIRNEYANKIKLTESIEKDLDNMKNVSKSQDTVWAIQEFPKIFKKIEEFLNSAEDEFFFIITPDFSVKDLQTITEEFIEKKRIFPDMQIKIALKVTNDHKNMMNRLFHANIELFHWDSGAILPFGLVLTEQSFLQTYLSSMNPKPQYDFVIFMENCSAEQLQGLHHLCLWVFTHLCKRIIFEKKKKDKNGNEEEDNGPEMQS